jgi:signal transduction histidine kinase/DNA-binding response OmpR family regulator
MDSHNANLSSEYLSPDIAELTRQRGGRSNDPLNKPDAPGQPQPQHAPKPRSVLARSFAKRLLPACIATPGALWWLLYFGQGRGWYAAETSFILFVFSVTVVFGVIVCLNLRKLAKMDRDHAAAEALLKLAKESAERANRFKSLFFANISHEIRTPLTAINGFAELLLNPKRTTEQRLDDARVIRRNGEHLLTLINDILDLSKIEAGRMTVERIHVCPAGLVGEVAAMLRPRAASKNLALDVRFDGPIPQSVHTDPTRVRQILINLVSNAIKFTKTGGVTVAVSISPTITDQRPLLQVKITDTGIGIASDKLGDLFQPFVQADTTIARHYGGTGLGLAISRHFSQALGGDISVTSAPGEGSTFTVTVETGLLAGIAINDRPHDALELKQEAFAHGGPQVAIKGTVLVAEDGADNQALITTRLRQTGLTVEVAPNGQVACDKALAAMTRNEPYDLILMDVQMPVMDGFTATLKLRAGGYRGPIIALTANAMERDRDKCMNAGCNDFVTKPIQAEKLFKAIGRYLRVELVKETPVANATAASSGEDRDKRVAAFYEKLREELEEMSEAVERQDRVRLKELAKLVLGNAVTLELKDLATESAKLVMAAEVEQSWDALGETVKTFAQDALPSPKRQAA